MRDGVAVGATGLAVVFAVRRVPGLSVEGAVETLGNTVLGKDVGVEEALQKALVGEQMVESIGTYASHELAVCCRVTRVVGCLGCACSGAGGRSVALALAEGEVLVAHVGVVALGIERRVDGASEPGRTVETCDSWRWSDLVVSYRMD